MYFVTLYLFFITELKFSVHLYPFDGSETSDDEFVEDRFLFFLSDMFAAKQK